MKDLKKLFFLSRVSFCVCVLISLSSSLYGKDNNNEIIVIGTGAITKENLAEARKLAISDAHIKGIETYLVKLLGRNGMINNFESIINEIIPSSGDVIENYDIRAEVSNRTSYKLLVSIKVNEKLMEEKLRNAGIVLYEGASLRVLFLISDRTSPEEMPFIWWDDPENKTNLSSSELLLHRLFQERGFDPVNRLTSVPEEGYNPELFKDDLTDEDAAKWGKLYSADLVILGKVDVNEFNRMSADIKAIQVENASVLASYSKEQIINNDIESNETVAQVQEKILTEGVTGIIPDILKVFKKEEEKLSRFDMKLKGLDSLRQVSTFVAFIKEKISGVVSVLPTRITHGSITMSIEFSGSKEAFIDKIKDSTDVPFAAEIIIDETGALSIRAM